MEDKILDSIKEMLGIVTTDLSFDSELLSFINAAFTELWQVGVSPGDGFSVTKDTLWSEFTNEQVVMAESKQFVFCKTKLIFDPPGNSFICDALEKAKDEAYWRLYIMKDGFDG